MKEALRFFKYVVGKLLKKELRTISGKVNLVGGIIVTVMAVLVFIRDTLIEFMNALLGFFNKPPIPTIDPIYLLAFFVFILVYFYLSSKTANG